MWPQYQQSRVKRFGAQLSTRVHKVRYFNTLESHNTPVVTPFDGGVLTGSTQHRGQQQVSQRQNKGQGPRPMLEQLLVLSCICSMAPLNSRWPEDTAAFPTDTNPHPTAYDSMVHEREQGPGCATHFTRVGILPLPTISRHTGNTG